MNDPTSTGVSMIEIPTITIIVVTVAAALYCLERMLKALHAIRDYVIFFYSARVNALHDATNEDILPSFELWWGEGAHDVARTAALRGIPSEARRFVPEAALAQAVQSYRSMAFHLASHANMGTKELGMISRLPKFWGIHRSARLAYDEHQKELESQRSALADAGFDVEGLESHFSPSK